MIKFFIRLYHRLAGHLLITLIDSAGNVRSEYVTSISTDRNLLVIDRADHLVDYFDRSADVTITGA